MAACPWPSVESRRLHRPATRSGCRPQYVRGPRKHDGLQRDTVTHDGTTKNGPHSRVSAATGPFSQRVAGDGFEPSLSAGGRGPAWAGRSIRWHLGAAARNLERDARVIPLGHALRDLEQADVPVAYHAKLGGLLSALVGPAYALAAHPRGRERPCCADPRRDPRRCRLWPSDGSARCGRCACGYLVVAVLIPWDVCRLGVLLRRTLDRDRRVRLESGIEKLGYRLPDLLAQSRPVLTEVLDVPLI